MGQAIDYLKAIFSRIMVKTSGNSTLCFRPFSPKREEGMSIVWKKYQVFSKAPEKFIEKIKRYAILPIAY